MNFFDKDFATQFANEWISNWNNHDLDSILDHYTEDVIFHSPMIQKLLGESTDKVVGKNNLRIYWTKGLALIPDLHFELVNIFYGAHCVSIHYLGHRGPVIETFFFDTAGKVYQACACYSDS